MRSRGRSAPLLLALALALAVAGCGGEDAGNGAGRAAPANAPPPARFTNPVLEGNFADPHLLKVGDTWYAYATGDLIVNLQVARSADLVHWERLDDALPELPAWSVLQKGLTWAPEVARTPAGYVMYYTVRHAASGRQCISAAVAERPEGPYQDRRPAPLVCQSRLGGSIDPHRFVDRDGAAYLLWKNDGNCCGLPTELWAQRLDGDGLELAGQPRRLGVRNDASWEGTLIEAPTLWREGDTYVLFFSANDYGSPDYAVGYATAAKVLGPYRDAPGNPILRSRGEAAGPGGQAVVDAGDGDLWLAYHAWDSGAVGDEAGGQRSLWLDRLRFQDGRPRVDGPTDTPQAAP
ncbi:MAG TPA: glycoside hydrolase family 43 protein [Actinomycetota bacterium]|nr:glycoside hydrolase family 43 protein [Actinomycetota bacterium]